MSIIDDCVQFLEDLILGDFNEQQMISAQVIGGLVSLIPVMDQVMDARDISGCLYRVNKRGGFAKATLDDKVDLGFAAFGVVPSVGSAFKTVFKPLYKQRKVAKGVMNNGVAMIERMLGHRKGGAVRWVKALDWAGNTQAAIVQADLALESCISMLEYLGQSHWWCPDRLERLARDVVPALRSVRGTLAAPIREAATAIRKFLEDMLGEHAAAVAMSVAAGAVTNARGAAPARNAQAAVRSRHPNIGASPRTQGRTGRASVVNSVQNIAYQIYAPLNFALKGLLGEHIVEHHVIEKKGWGLDWNGHDMHGGKKGKPAGWSAPYRKVNDNETPLYLCTPTNHVLQSGIDSAWFTNRGRPHQYAIVEAKASMNVNAKLADLLGEAADHAPQRPGSASGRRGSRASTPLVRNGNRAGVSQKPKVMQMSVNWIEYRIQRDMPRLQARMRGNYSRHVFLVTPLQAAEHVKAATKIIENGFVNNPAAAQRFALEHAAHNVQVEFDEGDLDRAEAQYKATGKAKKKQNSTSKPGAQNAR